MEDQTSVMSNPRPPEAVVAPEQSKAARENGNQASSHFFQVSIRGWIALLITVTFCAASMLEIPLDDTMKITVTAVISLYFGQNQKKT